MSYRALVERNVNKAFKLIGDLTITATLVKRTKSNFNFNTMDVKEVEAPNLTTSAVRTQTKKSSTEHNVRSSALMLKTQEIGDINLFDSVIINGRTFKIGPVISTDDFVTTVEILAEG